MSVLVLVSILSLIALEFTRKSSINLKMAANHALSKKALFYAYGGYETALKLLMMDTNEYDGPGDYWYAMLPPIPLEDGAIVVTIQDEKSRYNIKKLVTDYGIEDARRRVMLERIFEQHGIDTSIIDSLADWQDEDDVSLPYGAERMYYNSLRPSYDPRNAPVTTMGEIFLVRGFDRDLFFLPPVVRDPFLSDDIQPLEQYLTVYGNGSININTADRILLMSLSADLDEIIADDIVEYRYEYPFEAVEELKNVETVSDILYDEIESLITVKSDLFRITSTGSVDEFSRIITAVVSREGGRFRVVYFDRSL